MPAGLFDPTFDPEAGPLDLPTPAKKANQWKDLAPLLAILPLALSKGGRVGGAALLEGFQQARQQQAQEARQSSIDAENRSYRDATLQNHRDRLAMEKQGKADADANTAAARRQTFLSNFSSGLDRIETPEALEAYLRLQASQGTSVGVNEADLRGLAPAPTALQQKNARKRLEALEKQFGDKLYEQGPQFRYELAGEPAPVSFDELLRRAGQPRDPNASAPATPKDDDAPLDRRYLSASVKKFRETNKREPTAAEMQQLITEARKAVGQADDRPRVTVNTGAADARVNARIDRIAAGFSGSPLVKEFNETQAQYQNIKDVLSRPWSGPGDMSVVYAFMRALDPTSVVRETEYANAAKSGNIFAGWAAKFNGKLNPDGGFLAPQVRQSFLSVIEGRLKTKRAQYDNLRKQTLKRIDAIRSGKPETPDETLADYDAAFPESAPPAPPGAGTKTKVGRFEVEVGP